MIVDSTPNQINTTVPAGSPAALACRTSQRQQLRQREKIRRPQERGCHPDKVVLEQTPGRSFFGDPLRAGHAIIAACEGVQYNECQENSKTVSQSLATSHFIASSAFLITSMWEFIL